MTTIGNCSALAVFLAVVSCASKADEISVNQTRPMMVLAAELAERYGYLVTYEDAPGDSARDVVVDRQGKHDYGYPAWQPVTFHVDAREGTEGGVPIQEPLRTGSKGHVTISSRGGIRPLDATIIDPLVREYNESGNPGRFTAIYDGPYAHIVPLGRSPNGSLSEFLPILSTVVPVRVEKGECLDLFNSLTGEIRQIRGVTIQVAEWPVHPLFQYQCTIQGHDLTARQVLIQLLDQMGVHPGGFMANDHFVWTLVYDPTTNAYWMSTKVMPSGRLARDQPSGNLDRKP